MTVDPGHPPGRLCRVGSLFSYGLRDNAVGITPELAAEILDVSVFAVYELVRLNTLRAHRDTFRARRERHKYGVGVPSRSSRFSLWTNVRPWRLKVFG